MKKIALSLTILSFFFCYLEWGSNQSSFIYEVAYQVLFQADSYQSNFSHPLILLPFVGLLILLVLLFQKSPQRRWVITGLLLPGILVLFILLVGILAGNIKITASTVPFLASAAWGLWLFGRKNSANE
ncbi:MAG: hypothetical protein ACKVT2_14125 [Saprospiraceae bacterium]